MRLYFYRFVSLPDQIDRNLFINSALASQFVIYHDFKRSSTYLITDDKDLRRRLEASNIGLNLKDSIPEISRLLELKILIAFNTNERKDEKEVPLFWDMYKILKYSNSGLFLSFIPAEPNSLRKMKTRIEDLLSRKELRITKNFGARNVGEQSGSVQSEFYYGSEEKKTLLSILNTLDEAAMNNGCSYKLCFVFQNSEDDVYRYLKLKLLILEEKKANIRDLESLYLYLGKLDSLPISYDLASSMLGFSDRISRMNVIHTPRLEEKESPNSILFGLYLSGSSYETSEPIHAEISTLNLGVLITGLPGSGKTFAAMNLVSQVSRKGRTKVAVISPTPEWSAFGADIGMKVVKLYADDSKINFFNCPEYASKEKFYENLAMLLAQASNAGPYRNSMEKCLLSAFSKVYAKTRNPDPTEVYCEIEEAVIQYHGKRSKTGVKYTKHGENITAALENLRIMLMKPQFAYPVKTKFADIAANDVIFDLSLVSNNMKPFFYALLLNQMYALTEELDAYGDDELRVLICLEEAQLVFDNNEQSAATLDLRQRIQDFRKKGVGLLLITHSVTDINLRIRRLCQTKMYFRQSSDSVKTAAVDLIADDENTARIAERLKTLEHRTCVLNYVNIAEAVKNPTPSVFVRTPEYTVKTSPETERQESSKTYVDMRLRLLGNGGNPASLDIEISYVGEKIFKGNTDKDGYATVSNTLKDKKYKLTVFSENRKLSKTFTVIGGAEQNINLD